MGRRPASLVAVSGHGTWQDRRVTQDRRRSRSEICRLGGCRIGVRPSNTACAMTWPPVVLTSSPGQLPAKILIQPEYCGSARFLGLKLGKLAAYSDRLAGAAHMRGANCPLSAGCQVLPRNKAATERVYAPPQCFAQTKPVRSVTT